ncbi:hypothetical protein llap_14562 [Limosa lapponica baueri]|uniref:Uncharacterized protein n=1 Tax=Limosa lapponica baueri TaxID=1758121 RepID=A0A2I0TMV4_LIMLA|nr:hypothetical protein llap_14562 [Limosa lapponica baueri]
MGQETVPITIFLETLLSPMIQYGRAIVTHSPSWPDNPIVKTHEEPARQLPALRYFTEQLEKPLQISAQHSRVTANHANNADIGISL